MPIGDPTYSDDESDLSDYAGIDDEIGFDFNFRMPIDGLTASVGAPPTRVHKRERSGTTSPTNRRSAPSP